MSDDSRRFERDISAASDPISGRLGNGRHDGGFTGWLGLAAAFQSALGADHEDQPEEPERPEVHRGGRLCSGST
jgi:hypothetical protein